MKELGKLLLIAGFMPGLGYAMPIDASQDGFIGLTPVDQFKLSTGKCGDCKASPQALWYFENELIATPTHDGFKEIPPVVWLGSSKVLPQATLSEDGKSLNAADGNIPFSIVPKISTNLSYFDDSSLKSFKQRELKLRGEVTDKGEFLARTIWPMDFEILPAASRPLNGSETLRSLIQNNNGGAKQPFTSRVIWQADPTNTNWEGTSVVGLMLNGAQGDDDEAHGGHFGILTGRYQTDGDWSRWLVNNFYNLDSFSEKGIVAAPTPADKYLMDLNSGQSYYRPSYMLVAVMKDDSIAKQYQSSINKVFTDFYQHNFTYDHAKANCAGLSIDALRAMGWNVPKQGNGGYLKAIAAYFYVAVTTGSLKDARNVYNYITEENTRLNPAATFEAIGNDMFRLANGSPLRDTTPVEKQFMENLVALVYVHIPQVPSNRAFGQAPVFSFDEYLERAPADRADWKIVPVEPRPFPDQLKEGLAVQSNTQLLVPLPVIAAMVLLLSVLGIIALKLKRYAA